MTRVPPPPNVVPVAGPASMSRSVPLSSSVAAGSIVYVPLSPSGVLEAGIASVSVPLTVNVPSLSKNAGSIVVVPPGSVVNRAPVDDLPAARAPVAAADVVRAEVRSGAEGERPVGPDREQCAGGRAHVDVCRDGRRTLRVECEPRAERVRRSAVEQIE